MTVPEPEDPPNLEPTRDELTEALRAINRRAAAIGAKAVELVILLGPTPDAVVLPYFLDHVDPADVATVLTELEAIEETLQGFITEGTQT
jgi:hypothetical protein